ncbi:MAG: hypothetical protein LAT82_02005 [Nanoarchaeota archaeon]|nr:hypothetical protein [Nanoarchaeota archaeon]
MVLKDKINKQTQEPQKSLNKTNSSNKTQREIKTIKARDKNKEEEKDGIWEYVIIFGATLLFFVAVYFAFEYFDDRQQDPLFNVYKEMGIEDEGFIYSAQAYRGGQANVEFAFDLSTLEGFNFRQDITNDWFETNFNIMLATPDILENRTENALLIKTSGKFAAYLRHIQGIRLNEHNFITINNTTNCELSNENQAVIIYNYNASEIGVVIPEEFPNCILINANSTAVDFAKAIDKIMYDTIIAEN